MSRRRYLSSRISQDPRINRLAVEGGDFAALLYTWLIPHAEDDATFPADPEELLMAVIPGRRDKSAEDVADAIEHMLRLGVLERSADPRRLCFPDSFYEYQTYIRGERRKTAQPSIDERADEVPAHNSAKQRKTAQNIASFSPSSSFSSSFSPPTVPTEPTEGAPVAADAPPDAPHLDVDTALVVSEAATTRKRDPLFDALQTVFPKGPRTDAERGKWNTAAFQLRKGKVSPEEVLRAAENWPNVMSGATMTPMGIASNLGLLLDGPQVNGRSNGVTHGLQQTIRQSATLPPDDMALMRAAKAARRPH